MPGLQGEVACLGCMRDAHTCESHAAPLMTNQQAPVLTVHQRWLLTQRRRERDEGEVGPNAGLAAAFKQLAEQSRAAGEGRRMRLFWVIQGLFRVFLIGSKFRKTTRAAMLFLPTCLEEKVCVGACLCVV